MVMMVICRYTVSSALTTGTECWPYISLNLFIRLTIRQYGTAVADGNSDDVSELHRLEFVPRSGHQLSQLCNSF